MFYNLHFPRIRFLKATICWLLAYGLTGCAHDEHGENDVFPSHTAKRKVLPKRSSLANSFPNSQFYAERSEIEQVRQVYLRFKRRVAESAEMEDLLPMLVEARRREVMRLTPAARMILFRYFRAKVVHELTISQVNIVEDFAELSVSGTMEHPNDARQVGQANGKAVLQKQGNDWLFVHESWQLIVAKP